MTTEATEIGLRLSQVISDVQSDTKQAITALAVSLHSSHQLNALVLEEIAQKMLSSIQEPTEQNSGILKHLLFAAQAINKERSARG